MSGTITRLAWPDPRIAAQHRRSTHALGIGEALELARENEFDLIVLDVMMPEKDGYAVCKELKKDDQTRDIPIILLTAVASHVTSTRYSHYDGMATEADDYISKPASAWARP